MPPRSRRHLQVVPDQPPPGPDGTEHLHPRTRRAKAPARRLAAEQTAAGLARYREAVQRQEDRKLIGSGKVVPARITIALDVRGLYGPEVDEACDAAEPDVDLWECGLAVPTARQVELLAELTGFLPAWFYRPLPVGPLHEGPVFICTRDGKGGAVQPPRIDDRGVLHYSEDDPRQPPAGHWQNALFTAPPATGSTGRTAGPRARAHARETPPPADPQPPLPGVSGRMPDELRRELDARIEQARQRRKG